MPQLDLKTVVVVGLAIEVVCNLVMAALWRQGRRQYAGLGFWALNFAAQTTGLFLILLRGQLPIWLSVSAANVLLVVIGQIAEAGRQAARGVDCGALSGSSAGAGRNSPMEP